MGRFFRHLFSPSGRLTRSGWWFGILVVLATLFGLNFISGFLAAMYYCSKAASDSYFTIYCPAYSYYWGDPITWWVQYISLGVGLWCWFAINTKRLHDHNRSAWWNLIFLIPFVGFFIWIALLGIFRGDDAPNRYGE